MQLSNIKKSLLIAIPALVLTACGSTSEGQQEGASSQTAGQSQSAQANAASQDSAVEVNAIDSAAAPSADTVEGYEEKLVAEAQTVYFDYDKSKVDAKYLEILQAHANYLIKNPAQGIKIEGHCDERGTPEYNIALGERRAKAVAQYLQSLGVSASQITTVSYGEEKPVDLSRTNAGFAKNRRAELVY